MLVEGISFYNYLFGGIVCVTLAYAMATLAPRLAVAFASVV